MIENVDGTKMIRRVQNVEKTGFCDVGCRAGLTFWGCFWTNFSDESAGECEYAANFIHVVKHCLWRVHIQMFLMKKLSR